MIGRVAVWLLIAFVLFTVFRQFDNSATAPMNAEQTSYTQFMQDAKDGKIRRVDVQGRKITVTPVEGASYVITSPGDLWMLTICVKTACRSSANLKKNRRFCRQFL